MRFDATFPLQSAIWRNSGGFVPALVLILAALLVAARPAQAAGPQAQPPAAKRPGNARTPAKQTTPPNVAAAPNAVPAQSAVQNTAPMAEPVLRPNLVQDPLRVAIDQAVQKGKQDAAANAAANPAKTKATQTAPGSAAPGTSPNATTNAPQNTSPNASPNTNATSGGPPAVNGATNPNQPAAARLVCQGTRPATGAAFTLLFDPNANPAPAAGDACIPTGQPKAVGQAVMSSAPKTGPALAVVLVPPATAGGGNTSATGSASERLVCQGTRPATGAAYTLLFDPNANPAPAAGDACIPTGQPKAV